MVQKALAEHSFGSPHHLLALPPPASELGSHLELVISMPLMQYSIIQYNTVQYSTIQYTTVKLFLAEASPGLGDLHAIDPGADDDGAGQAGDVDPAGPQGGQGQHHSGQEQGSQAERGHPGFVFWGAEANSGRGGGTWGGERLC